MLMIRFQRIGRTNDPAFRIALLEKHRAAKTGRVIEQLGSYNPKTKAFNVDETRVKELMGNGAQLTDSVKNLFINKGVIEGQKVNVIPAKVVNKKVEDEAAAAAAAKAEAEAAAAAPVVEAPTEEAIAAEAEEVPAEEPKAEEAAPAAAEEAPAEEPKAEEAPAA